MITNIHLARTLDNQRLIKRDIKVGLVVYLPSGTGGVLQHSCVSLNDDNAVFESFYGGCNSKYTMRFNVPAFTFDQFLSVDNALKHNFPLDFANDHENSGIVCLAAELGYVYIASYCQVGWTGLGIESFNTLFSDKGDKQ
ncbi:MAG: hypothetical protein V7749_00750 [Cocleimonas sp.]